MIEVLTIRTYKYIHFLCVWGGGFETKSDQMSLEFFAGDGERFCCPDIG